MYVFYYFPKEYVLQYQQEINSSKNTTLRETGTLSDKRAKMALNRSPEGGSILESGVTI